MIKSMTGFGRSYRVVDGKDILVEIKAVNHRYFEFSAKVPRAYLYLEEFLKKLIQKDISRGKVEVSVSIYENEGKNAQVELNRALASGYVKALREIKNELNVVDDLSLSALSRFSDIFSVRKLIEDENAVWNSVKAVAEEALKGLIAMREKEGSLLQSDLQKKIEEFLSYLSQIEAYSSQISAAYYEKLYAKLSELLNNRNIDDQRILTEAAVFAEKVAIDEEIVRLNSHIQQFQELLTSQEPIERKTDFLIQEINREVNTIGSKSPDIKVVKIVIEMKSIIEKMREQIQNIE